MLGMKMYEDIYEAVDDGKNEEPLTQEGKSIARPMAIIFAMTCLRFKLVRLLPLDEQTALSMQIGRASCRERVF